MGLLQITTLINTNFASQMGEGSNSYIYYADRLLELPLSLVSVSLGTALLPTLSRLWVSQEKSKMIETANYYVRLNLFVAIPAALGLFFLGIPIVELLFQRGKFSAADALETGSILQVYAFTLVVSSSVRVLVPSLRDKKYLVSGRGFRSLLSRSCFHCTDPDGKVGIAGACAFYFDQCLCQFYSFARSLPLDDREVSLWKSFDGSF